MALVRPSSFTVLCMLLSFFFFFNDTATTEIYTLSLHDALPIPPPRSACPRAHRSWSYPDVPLRGAASRPALRTLTCVAVRSEEHTSELQSQSKLVCRLLLEKKKEVVSHS